MKILIIGDPLERLSFKSDSSLALAQCAIGRKHEVWWADSREVYLRDAEVMASCRRLLAVSQEQVPHGEPEERWPLHKFGAILIRKDPPFDASYVRLCWFLCLLEKKVLMVNRPSLLLRYHEKLVPIDAVVAGCLKPKDIIPTLIGPSARVGEFIDGNPSPEWISKPFLGYGGSAVNRFPRDILKSLPPTSAHFGLDRLIQPFQPEIRHGDRRVFFLNGKLLAHFMRVPPEGGFVSNLAQGGSARKEKLSRAESAVIERLGKFLKKIGVVLAGADLIGAKVSEVNVTSPTGLRSLEQLEGVSYAEPIIKQIERSVPARRR